MTDSDIDAFIPDTHDDLMSVDLPAYEGPLYLLLDLARAKKVDLAEINVLSIADQFLKWFQTARSLRLELAADWLVMAATLALLKSRMLIPVPKEEKAAADALIEDLSARLRRLDAVRSMAEELAGRRRLGIHWHRAGDPSSARGANRRLDANLHSLLLAYVREARLTLVPQQAPVRRPFIVMSVEEAIAYLTESGVLDADWKPITAIVPATRTIDEIHGRSKIAASYVASLEMAKRGAVEIRQAEHTVELRIPETAA